MEGWGIEGQTGYAVAGMGHFVEELGRGVRN